MALSNLACWADDKASSACGASDKPAETPAACGAAGKPDEKPSACGASDKPEGKPSACGSACGAADK